MSKLWGDLYLDESDIVVVDIPQQEDYCQYGNKCRFSNCIRKHRDKCPLGDECDVHTVWLRNSRVGDGCPYDHRNPNELVAYVKVSEQGVLNRFVSKGLEWVFGDYYKTSSMRYEDFKELTKFLQSGNIRYENIGGCLKVNLTDDTRVKTPQRIYEDTHGKEMTKVFLENGYSIAETSAWTAILGS